MTISALIIDDEVNGRENLAGLLKTHFPDINVTSEVASVSEAISAIDRYSPDLVFLDIEMPGGNGFKLLEHYKDFPFEVIFVTAYDNYAIKAIRFSVADYILKPINLNELKTAVQKATKQIELRSENERIKQLYYNVNHPRDPKIGLPTNDRIEFVEVKSIVRCQGESNYTHIYFSDRNPLLVAKTLVEFEDLLQEYDFLRVHKTHLINLKYVTAFLRNEGGQLLLSSNEKISVSRRRKEEVIKRLKQFLK